MEIQPQYKVEYFESSMDLCQLESFKGFSDDRNSIIPLAESNRTVDECIHCNDRADDYECAECTCQICGYKTKAAMRYRCSSCKKVFHEWCQNISDATSMADDWQCMNCAPRDVKPSVGDIESVVRRFTRSIIIRKDVTTTRKMNNAPRTSECTIVPANHFGPIPNIPVGSCWEYRLQVSEVGVHRPLVAGIHGRENEGAYSIVISGVYPDDFDNGDEFFYSGSGGKVKDPSKRLGAQVRNQSLTKQNRALALNCNCPLNEEKGGVAKNWRKGKPVRVIRNWKLSKISKYAPKEGNRYDGIYKVVKYFPQTGHSGFLIWKYLLKRDDPTPAPWTREGKRLIAERGLKMIKAYPDEEITEKYKSTTFKLEISDEEPLKKTIRRVRQKSDDLFTPPPVKRERLDETNISSPKNVVNFKNERLSPPPSPQPMITFEENVDTPPLSVIHETECLTKIENSSNVELKSSPTSESKIPASSKVSEVKDEDVVNSFSHIKSMDENTDTSTTFTHSIHIDSAYTLNVNNVTNSNNSFSKLRSPSKDTFTSPKYIRQPEQLPITKLTLPCFGSTDNDEFAFKPIKLTMPKPIVLKPEMTLKPQSVEEDKSSATAVTENNSWELADNIKELLGKDVINKGWWDMCIDKYLPLGKQSFMEKVSQIFTCPCCHKITDKPVTLKCENKHSACLSCMNHRFNVLRVRSCPSCQERFGPSIKLKLNENLTNILSVLFPNSDLNSSYLV